VNKFFQSVCSDLDPLGKSLVPPPPPGIIEDKFIIDTTEVERLLANTNVNKSPGPDEVPNWILRDLVSYVSGPITSIFNASVREGFVPQIWKRANVVPVPKCNPPRDITGDLRPISLTPTLSKHLEKVVGTWMIDSIKSHGKLDPDQYGGMPGLSTTHLLVDALHHWYEAAEERNITNILFIDYSKAYDHIDHSIVIQKLLELEVPTVIVRWVAAFLDGRQQRVKIGQKLSEWLELNGSIVQGSWIGPKVFITILINLVLHLRTHKFMDDTTVSESVAKQEDSTLQEAADKIVEISDKNKMKLNAKKTKTMTISFKKKPNVLEPIVIKGSEIETVTSFKLVGLNISNNLKWDVHVDSICSKGNQRVYFIKKLKQAGLSQVELIKYFTTYIRPVLEYACPAFHNALTVELSGQIENIQKRTLKIIYPGTSYDQALATSGLVSLETRREQLCKKFYCSIKQEGSKLHYLLPKTKTVTCELRNPQRLAIKTCKTKRASQSFINYAVANYE